MVRILSCHHFRGQRIGRCDEAVGVAVAGDAVIVALEHQVNIYGRADPNVATTSTSWSSDASSPSAGFGTYSFGHAFDDNRIYDLGTQFSYHATSGPAVGSLNQLGRPRTVSGSSSADSVESDTELRLSHNFTTIDFIENISYNEAGKYILCLERRETSADSNTTSVRAYFNWEKSHSKPMKARIAGLVSPTGAEPEEDSLMMVEIPLTSPATAVTSCNLSGHLATLSAESILNIFLFRAKEASGRVKVHYFDFDRVYSIEMPGFVPEKISFLTDFIACMNPTEVRVFRVKKEDAPYLKDSPVSPAVVPVSKSKPPAITSFFTDTKPHSDGKGFQSLPVAIEKKPAGKVVFDPKNETVKVHLNSIVRANRRRKCPSALISEEYHDEISIHKTKVVFSAIHPGITVDDVMRVYMCSVPGSASNNSKFLQVEMYPIRVKEHLGGIALLIASVKEGFLYHLPSKKDCTQVTRVTTYPLTAPLLSFTFDSLFFHALTETGLESYTSRCLFYALRDTEGFQILKNDCPLQEESPCLVGIRPFLRVRHIVCNDRSLCLLACSHQTAASGKKLSSSLSNEENMWTIYTLDLPDIDTIYEDIMRTANLQADSNREAYFTLICEAHTLLRLYLNAHPGSEFAFSNKLKETCKLIGLEYLKSSWINPLLLSETPASTPPVPAASPNSLNQSYAPSIGNASSPVQFDLSVSEHSALNISEDLLEKGVTYLVMAKCDLQEIFSQENSSWVKDPHLIPGMVRLIDTILSDLPASNSDNIDNHKIPPALAPSLVDFLAMHGSKVLIDLVIRSVVFRECNTRRLIHVLSHLTENRRYHAKVTLALILTLVTIGGVDESTRNQINGILQKTNIHELETIIPQEAIFECRGKQVSLTDLAVCLAHSKHSQLLIDIVVGLLKRHSFTVSEIMLAFAQAVNLNSDAHLQHCITKCLTSILEAHLSRRLKLETQNTQAQPLQVSSPVVLAAGVASTTNLHFTDEEKRAVQTLVRTYLSNFSLALSHSPAVTDNTASDQKNASSNNAQQNVSDVGAVNNTHKSANQEHDGTDSDKKVPPSNEDAAKNCCFGLIPSFVSYLLSLNTPGGNISPQSQNITTSPLLTCEESRENFTKLLSLLSSELANFDGVRDLILTYLYKSNSQKAPLDPVLFVILQVLSEPADRAVQILLTKQPTTVLLFAKEIFGRKTASWKILVSHLKKNVQVRCDSVEGDMFATILESVYLHLANTLTPTELEQVLDKETEESTKFHSICKRVELANTYANMVITVSTEYLKQN